MLTIYEQKLLGIKIILRKMAKLLFYGVEIVERIDSTMHKLCLRLE